MNCQAIAEAGQRPLSKIKLPSGEPAAGVASSADFETRDPD